jgi:hypothetical protein
MSALVVLALFAAPVAVAHTGATFDAEAKLVAAAGAAAADLRYPSAAVARVKAERQARAAAEKKIVDALVELGDTRDADAIGKDVAQAKITDERFGSDGSVQLTLSFSTADLTLKPHHRKRR